MAWIPHYGLYAGERKLQILHTDTKMCVVDKETQQTIDGVADITIKHDLDFDNDTVNVSGEITIKITDPEDIMFISNIVEGSVVPAYPQLPEVKE